MVMLLVAMQGTLTNPGDYTIHVRVADTQVRIR